MRGPHLPKIAAVVVIIEGVFLIILMCASIYLNYRAITETEENRRIACVGRFLDGENYAPGCVQYVDEFRGVQR